MVKDLINTLKKGDFDKAQQYMIVENNGLDFEGIKNDQLVKELYNKIFANLQYEILETKSNNDSATVKLKTTNLDMDKITKEAIAEILSQQLANAFTDSEEELSDDDVIKLIIQKMDDPSAQKVIIQNDIKLRKDPNDKKLKVVNNANFAYTIAGNIGKSLNNITAEEPEAEEDPNAPGSRNNPVRTGEAGIINVSISPGGNQVNYMLSITVKSVTRGDEAWQIIEKENMFNDPPPEGKEYMLIKTSIAILDADSEEEPFYVSEYDFKFVSSKGNTYKNVSVVIPDPLDAELYKGGSSEGNIAALVDKGDEVAMHYEFGNRRIWFSLK
ncbi:MAG TPA: hypothetical protein GXX14_14180 [Clostridiaceae bacterium]|nr:hypothetical protein [Clostridiaceae bacterium]